MEDPAEDDGEWVAQTWCGDGSSDDEAAMLLSRLSVGEPEEPRAHDGIPISGYCGGEPIPDLGMLPRERWREVLRPLRPATRLRAVSGVPTPADASAGFVLLSDLGLEDATSRARAGGAPPPRMPAGTPPARGSSRQINFRLGPNEHERLLEAAKLFAMRPTTLARVLTIRGVDRALYEERRDR